MESTKVVLSAVLILALVVAAGLLALFFLFSRAIEIQYTIDDEQAGDHQGQIKLAVRNTVAEYEILNPRLVFREVETGASNIDLSFRFLNLSDGTPTRPGSNQPIIFVDYGHYSCDNRFVQYTAQTISHFVIPAISQHLTSTFNREFATPAFGQTTELIGESELRSQITQLEGLITPMDQALMQYPNRVPFAEYNDYLGQVATRNALAVEFNMATENISCLLNQPNAYANYAPLTPNRREDIFRYAVTTQNQSIARSADYEEIVDDAVSSWTALNSNMRFIEVPASSPDLNLIIDFVNIPESSGYDGVYCSDGCSQALRRGVNSNTDPVKPHAEIVIDAGKNTCDNEFAPYEPDYLSNITTHEIGHFLGLGHSSDRGNLLYAPDSNALRYRIPFDDNPPDYLVGEAELNSEITRLSNNVGSYNSFLNRYRFVDRIPYSDWLLYQRQLNNRNRDALRHNDAVNELDCLLNVAFSSFTFFEEVEAKRREGAYNYAFDLTVQLSSNYQQLIREAFDRWEALNPRIDFTLVSRSSPDLDVYIDYLDIPESENYVGLHCSRGCGSRSFRASTNLPSNNYSEILVDIGARTCRNQFVNYTPLYIVDVTMHEIGHLLRLGHTSDMSHLLFGSRNPFPMVVFDDLGYNIPAIPNWEHTREGVAELTQRLDRITLYFESDGTRIVQSGALDDARRWHNEIRCINGFS